MFLTNALPASVLVDPTGATQISITPLPAREAAALVAGGHLVSAVGHEDTAAVISSILVAALADDPHPAPCHVQMNRISIPPLAEGESLVAALYTGGRLPEGSKTLPDGASLDFYLVTRQGYHHAEGGARIFEEVRA